MHPQIAKATLNLLARVDIKGNEAPALMEIVKVLEGYANPQALPLQQTEQVPTPAP
jgi:hypothetical protein